MDISLLFHNFAANIEKYTMESNANNRIEYIDALRGFTMILVVYHHIAFWCFDNEELAYNEFFIKFRMPTFFFISGWLFFKINRIWDKETINGILKKKFMVQIIPFLLFMLLYMYMFRGPDYYTTFESKYGFWFTYTLFQYFVIYIVIEALFNKKQSNKREFGVMLFMLVLSIIAFYYHNIRFTYNLGIYRPILTLLSFTKMKYIIFFWLGTFVKKNFESFIRITDNQYVIAICLCLFVPSAIFSKEIYYSSIELKLLSFLSSGLFGIIIAFTFFRRNKNLFSKNKRIGKALQFIGQRTLDIYLLHYFVLPYHRHEIALWLLQYSHKSVDMLIILIISLWIIFISLMLSKIIRLSPFLGHYLFGAKRVTTLNKTDT